MNIINNIKGLNDKSLQDLVNWVGVPNSVQSIEFKQIIGNADEPRSYGTCIETEAGHYLILICQQATVDELWLETLVHEIKHIEHWVNGMVARGEIEVYEAEAEATEAKLQSINS